MPQGFHSLTSHTSVQSPETSPHYNFHAPADWSPGNHMTPFDFGGSSVPTWSSSTLATSCLWAAVDFHITVHVLLCWIIAQSAHVPPYSKASPLPARSPSWPACCKSSYRPYQPSTLVGDANWPALESQIPKGPAVLKEAEAAREQPLSSTSCCSCSSMAALTFARWNVPKAFIKRP